MKNKNLLTLSLTVLVAVSGRMCYADDPVPTRSSSGSQAAKPSYDAASATVEQYMQQAIRNLAIRYNLNDAQARSTEELMTREVYKFLREHEAQVWPAIRDLLGTRMGLRPPTDPKEIMRIGKGSQPLVRDARKAIFQANEQWRRILTPEQKALHDFDLAEMRKTFKQIDKNLQEWAQGRTADGGIFPRRIPQESPPRPHKPADGLLPVPPEPEIVEVFTVSIFETFVEQFIKDYQLGEGQIDSARSILKEFKGRADDFKKTHEAKLKKIALAQQQATNQRDQKRLRLVESQRKKTLAPIHTLFAEMETRLRALLNSAQIARYNKKQNAVDLGPKSAQASKPTTPRKKTSQSVKPHSTQPAESATGGSAAHED